MVTLIDTVYLKSSILISCNSGIAVGMLRRAAIESTKEGDKVNPRKELEKIIPYRPPHARKGNICMDLNESMKGCSPTVVKALQQIECGTISQYPDYYTLQQKIAAYHTVHPDNILLTNGADEAIRCIIDAYLGKKDEIVIPVPTFPMFDIIAKTRGATVVNVLYNNDLSFPKKAVLDRLTSSPKMIAIVNPGSPTGTLLKRKDLITIIKKANQYNTIVLLDEAYADFAGVTNVDLIRFTNVLVTRTFSKSFGLAGLRLGYAVSDSCNIENLYKVRLPFSVNATAVIAGCAALDDVPYMETVVKETNKEKTFLHNELKKIKINSVMTNTNFLLVHLGEKCDNVHEMLNKKGILVKNLKGAPLLTGWLRVTMGTHQDNEAFLAALKKVTLEAILFDMDGVLVDEKESYILAAQKTAEHFLDEIVDIQEILHYKAKGGFNNNWDVAEAVITSRGNPVDKDAIINQFQQYYLGENFDGFIQNEKWLLDLSVLQELKKNFSVGIVTGRLREEAVYTLKRFGMEKYFDVIITTDEVEGKVKPDPYSITLALKRLQVNRAVYVGDTLGDAQAADNAGVFFVGVSAHNEVQEFFTTLGVPIVKTVNDIQKVL